MRVGAVTVGYATLFPVGGEDYERNNSAEGVVANVIDVDGCHIFLSDGEFLSLQAEVAPFEAIGARTIINSGNLFILDVVVEGWRHVIVGGHLVDDRVGSEVLEAEACGVVAVGQAAGVGVSVCPREIIMVMATVPGGIGIDSDGVAHFVAHMLTEVVEHLDAAHALQGVVGGVLHIGAEDEGRLVAVVIDAA